MTTGKDTNQKATPTILSRDLIIEGKISSTGLIEIEGKIQGSINGNIVIVRENGNVEGEIISENLSIKGNFDGTIKSKNISISNKANVKGSIEYKSLSVEDGASIDGEFKKIT